MCLWDEAFQNCLKTYDLTSTAITSGGGARLVVDHPPVRALALGQGKILVGTKNSEVFLPQHTHTHTHTYKSITKCACTILFCLYCLRFLKLRRVGQSDC